METFTLVRFKVCPWGTCGWLITGDEAPLATLEPVSQAHREKNACIAPGAYICVRKTSQRFGETFIVTETPGRDGILFHAGNLANDTSGCILLGRSFEYIQSLGSHGIAHSRVSVESFRRRTAGLRLFLLRVLPVN